MLPYQTITLEIGGKSIENGRIQQFRP